MLSLPAATAAFTFCCCLPRGAPTCQVCECVCECVPCKKRQFSVRNVFSSCCCLLRVSCPFFPLLLLFVLCFFLGAFARFFVVFIRRITARVFRIRLLFELLVAQLWTSDSAPTTTAVTPTATTTCRTLYLNVSPCGCQFLLLLLLRCKWNYKRA